VLKRKEWFWVTLTVIIREVTITAIAAIIITIFFVRKDLLSSKDSPDFLLVFETPENSAFGYYLEH